MCYFYYYSLFGFGLSLFCIFFFALVCLITKWSAILLFLETTRNGKAKEMLALVGRQNSEMDEGDWLKKRKAEELLWQKGPEARNKMQDQNRGPELIKEQDVLTQMHQESDTLSSNFSSNTESVSTFTHKQEISGKLLEICPLSPVWVFMLVRIQMYCYNKDTPNNSGLKRKKFHTAVQITCSPRLTC